MQRGVTGVTVTSITKSQGELGSKEAIFAWWSAGGSVGTELWLHLLFPICLPGSEWRYVIVSTVRTCPRTDVDQRPTKSWLKKFLGFVVDPHQVNVAITRAQEGLCIIGEGLCGWGRLGKAVPSMLRAKLRATLTLPCRGPSAASLLPTLAPSPRLL